MPKPQFTPLQENMFHMCRNEPVKFFCTRTNFSVVSNRAHAIFKKTEGTKDAMGYCSSGGIVIVYRKLFNEELTRIVKLVGTQALTPSTWDVRCYSECTI